MRRSVFTVVLLLTLGFGGNAIAAMRVTRVDGTEVTVSRGPAKARKPNAVATNGRRIVAHADVTVNAGADIDAANNDYRRIQNAINAAVSTDTITLAGTFDFTAPFAAAAWALGNDNTAATGDDYMVLVPAGLNNVTLTATALGNATIQGPGDLAAINLESFLVFDASVSGASTAWTISNLRILDFDLSIGMFAVAVSDYNDTTIQNNFIRIPTDLNATVAPADVNQNIGLHLSFGTNQSILNNAIEVAGDGVSDTGGGNFSSSVGLQSNTSGGAVYDGLLISGNTLHVLNAQSADPQVVLGFWENAHGHTSGITVTNNSFLNDAGGNSPALNVQRAFRVTSHSGVSSTVTYSNNIASGANIGFQWLAAAAFGGNQAVVLTGNQLTNCATGVLVQSQGSANLLHNSITGSGAGLNNIDGTVVAERNWWGSNLAVPVAAEVTGTVDFDPWLASGTDVSGAFAFQAFTYATTSGTLTTFVGTGAADTGALLAGDPVTMQMNGDTAFTALAELLNFDIQLGALDDLFTLGQTGIPTIFDGGTGNDTLIGTNVAQTWNITGAGSGNIPGATSSFIGVESVRGGTAVDSFLFGAAGSLALTLDGNLGVDSLDNSAIPASTITPTAPGTLDGFMGTATGIGAGFDNINAILNAPADLSITKTGPATASTNTTIVYTITVTNAGPDPAIDVELTDVLPAGTTFVSLVAPGGWSCTTPAVSAAGTVTCTRLSMPVGADPFTLTINGPAIPGNVGNTATVTSANESAPGNEAATATVTVAADIVGIPTASGWALLALAMMLGTLAVTRLRL